MLLYGLYAVEFDTKEFIPVLLYKFDYDYYSPFRKIELIGEDRREDGLWFYRFWYEIKQKRTPKIFKEDLPVESFWDAPKYPTKKGALKWFEQYTFGWQAAPWT